MSVKIIILINIISLLFVDVTAQNKPCGQHKIKFIYFRNCKDQKYDTGVVDIQNITFKVTPDCAFVPRGCFFLPADLTDAKIDYVVNKPPIKKADTTTLCKTLSDPDVQQMASKFKTVDYKCPIKAGQYCITKGRSVLEKINPSILNMLAGTTKGSAIITNQKTNAKSCVELEVVVSKKK